jgi:hypothetical protein
MSNNDDDGLTIFEIIVIGFAALVVLIVAAVLIFLFMEAVGISI